MTSSGGRFIAFFLRLRELRRNPRIGYGAVAVSVALAVLAHWQLENFLIAGAPFFTLFPAVIVSTFVGGLGPGLLSLVVSAIAADYLVLVPPHSLAWNLDHIVALGMFLVAAGTGVVLVAILNALIDHLWERSENTRCILEASPSGVIAVDETGEITLVNAAVEQQFGYSRDELMGKNVEMLVPPHVRTKHMQLRTDFMKHPTPRAMDAGRELHGSRKDGSQLSVEIGFNPIVRDGRQEILATILDVGQRKVAEERQKMLMQELQHRAQNMFTVLQVIANRTLVPGKTVDECRKDLISRIGAMSRAFDLARREGEAKLGEIVAEELGSFEDRIDVQGSEILLTPSAAQNFALIVHELVTNAAKHGALSAPDGSISVRWSREGEGFHFLWEERDGPRAGQPTREGFGQILLRALAKEFGSDVSIEFHETGLRYELHGPMARIASASPPTAETLRH
jgi:PAS domain S-box-containing protein